MGPKEFQKDCVEGNWQNSCEGLSGRLDAVRKRGIWTDCVVMVVESLDTATSFPAHRVLLAATSPVLASLIFGSIANEDKFITLPNSMDPIIFDLVLDYIYTDKINITSCEIACGLYSAADSLQISKVVHESRTYLLNFVSAECAIFVYEFAKKNEESDLMEKCLKLINTETTQVLKQIEVANEDMVEEIFSLPHLDIPSEMVLFKATERWLKNHAEACKQEDAQQPREKIRAAIKQIRFLTLKPEEFAAHDTSSLLSESEMLAILLNLSSKHAHMPMPEGFCEIREPRIANIRVTIRLKETASCHRSQSQEHRLHNLPWRIRFQRTGSGKLLLDVECNWGQIGQKWACKADVSVSLLSQDNTKPDVLLAKCFSHRYHGYGFPPDNEIHEKWTVAVQRSRNDPQWLLCLNFRNHRYRYFWPARVWATWTDPTNGCVKNDCLVIEAKVMASPPVFDEQYAVKDRKIRKPDREVAEKQHEM